MNDSTKTDYMKYRGRCKELCAQAISEDPTLSLVRGYYHCPFWGKQQHWWTVRPDGTIHDPSVKQFPSKGLGEYEEFSGMVSCEQCGKRVPEEYAVMQGPYPTCSGRCAMRLVGL